VSKNVTHDFLVLATTLQCLQCVNCIEKNNFNFVGLSQKLPIRATWCFEQCNIKAFFTQLQPF